MISLINMLCVGFDGLYPPPSYDFTNETGVLHFHSRSAVKIRGLLNKPPSPHSPRRSALS